MGSRVPPERRVSATPEAVGLDAAQQFAAAAQAAVSARGAFRVALSGGSTPRLMYRALRELGGVPWEAVQVYFSDERCVPPDSEESNYRLAFDELLSRVPVPEANIHRLKGELDPHQAARQASAELPEQMDVVLLGMGDDGHTASLFPGSDGLTAQERGVIANWVPKLGRWRLSFTFPEINAARERWLLVTGASKHEVLRQVWAGEGDYPVSRVENPLWFLDAGAAG